MAYENHDGVVLIPSGKLEATDEPVHTVAESLLAMVGLALAKALDFEVLTIDARYIEDQEVVGRTLALGETVGEVIDIAGGLADCDQETYDRLWLALDEYMVFCNVHVDAGECDHVH